MSREAQQLNKQTSNAFQNTLRAATAVSLLCLHTLLTGCGTGLTTQAAASSTSGNTATPTSRQSVQSITNFGDSITCGFFATPVNGTGYVHSVSGYAGLFDYAVGVPAANLCRPGDQASDMAYLWVYPNAAPTVGANQLYTAMIGTNDVVACGPSTGCLNNYQQALSASLAWLGLPDTDKVLGNSSAITRTGQWLADPNFDYAQYAFGAGASLSLPIKQTVAGRNLYIGYRVWDCTPQAGGTAVVTVDGVPVSTLSSSQPGHPISTLNGSTSTIFLTTIPLGAAGNHTVTITTNSENTALFDFVWAGVSSQDYTKVPGAPRVLTGQIITSTNPAYPATIAVYNGVLQQVIDQLTGDGLYIQTVATADLLDPSNDFSDTLHPNNGGHAKVAAAYQAVLGQ